MGRLGKAEYDPTEPLHDVHQHCFREQFGAKGDIFWSIRSGHVRGEDRCQRWGADRELLFAPTAAQDKLGCVGLVNGAVFSFFASIQPPASSNSQSTSGPRPVSFSGRDLVAPISLNRPGFSRHRDPRSSELSFELVWRESTRSRPSWCSPNEAETVERGLHKSEKAAPIHKKDPA